MVFMKCSWDNVLNVVTSKMPDHMRLDYDFIEISNFNGIV